jgi:hypothetical protein
VTVARYVLDYALYALAFHSLLVLVVLKDNLRSDDEKPTTLRDSALGTFRTFLNLDGNGDCIAATLARLSA